MIEQMTLVIVAIVFVGSALAVLVELFGDDDGAD